MVVLGDGIRDVATVGGAGDDDAQLDVERHPLLEHARHAAELVPSAAASSASSSTATWPLPS